MLDVNGAVCVRSNHFSLVELPVLFVVRFVRKQVSCTDRLFSVSKKKTSFFLVSHSNAWAGVEVITADRSRVDEHT